MWRHLNRFIIHNQGKKHTDWVRGQIKRALEDIKIKVRLVMLVSAKTCNNVDAAFQVGGH